MSVPVQFFQATIAIELAVAGALLWEIRFFERDNAKGRGAASLVTIGVAVSLLPVLIRVLPPLARDARTSERNASYAVTVVGLILYAVVVGGIIAMINID